MIQYRILDCVVLRGRVVAVVLVLFPIALDCQYLMNKKTLRAKERGAV